MFAGTQMTVYFISSNWYRPTIQTKFITICGQSGENGFHLVHYQFGALKARTKNADVKLSVIIAKWGVHRSCDFDSDIPDGMGGHRIPFPRPDMQSALVQITPSLPTPVF